MGSWSFIIIQTFLVAIWMALNLVGYVYHWDVYPFILLNLVFSTQAAYAAPIIMMAQNRQNDRDRVQAKADYQTMMLRREFTVKPGLKRAVAHVCGLGQHEVSVNGRKVGEDLLSPGWTKYDKTCLYDTHDITAALHPGPNELRLLLGHGMYDVTGGRYTKFKGTFGPLKAIAQLRLEYADGTAEIIGTDARWAVSSGPLTFSRACQAVAPYSSQRHPSPFVVAAYSQLRLRPAHQLAGVARSRSLFVATPLSGFRAPRI